MNSTANLSANKTLVRCLEDMGIDGAERWHELRAESATNKEADAKLGLEIMAATGHVIWSNIIHNWRTRHGINYRNNGEMSDAEFDEAVRRHVYPGRTWEHALKFDAEYETSYETSEAM